MLTIGLTGGIASGKSTVAQILQEQGAVVLDADRFAHEVLQVPEVVAELAERWGQGVLRDDGSVDRQRLAERVFGETDAAVAERRFLEQMVHPRVRERLEQELEQQSQAGGRVAVLDVPLLLDAGWREMCDLVLFVDSPQDARLARAVERGWDPHELAQREAAQLPISEKRQQADAVIANDSDRHTLRRRTLEFWHGWVEPRLG
ncbi:MAG: dephospho-CoA kinase [Planctomycetales bacterium]|nr:dephospho-CoA kinase [Planctomycetales bacterium]